MTGWTEQRWAGLARKSRRVQDAIEQVRGVATAAGVRVEVAADGRITALELSDPGLAQRVSDAHGRALREVGLRVAELRRVIIEDPVAGSALRFFARLGTVPPEEVADGGRGGANPYALPPAVRRRHGLA
ncbi:hypothetical protein [Nocardia sp. NBC_00511]|uniref:hypothetical protein n=1 Tax=Nocardia sp. NBC_00511 TaxID=2903591 RepID=UPI0030DF0BF6